MFVCVLELVRLVQHCSVSFEVESEDWTIMAIGKFSGSFLIKQMHKTIHNGNLLHQL